MSETEPKERLHGAYSLDTPESARDYYDDWAGCYDAELARNAYATPARAAEALARFAEDRSLPIADFGCGTGLAGVAFAAEGFTTIDGYDISPEMLKQAASKGVYRYLATCDMSQPLEIEDATYAHAAAVGALNPQFMPATVIDEILRTVEPGGCFAFSINDKHLDCGTLEGRVMDLTDTGYADLVLRERGEHLPGIDLESTIYVLRRR